MTASPGPGKWGLMSSGNLDEQHISFEDWLRARQYGTTSLVDDAAEEGGSNNRRKGASISRGIRQRYPLEDGVAPAAAPGNRRYRRLLNDKILRDMAGPLTAEDMEQLYAPPPWGFTPPKSAFEEAAETREWDSFRCIDMDVEMEILSQDGGAKAGGRRDESGHAQDTNDGSRRWHYIGKTARTAIKDANPDLVNSFESRLISFISSDEIHTFFETRNAYHRLLIHGLCQYYQLESRTQTPSESRYFIDVRKLENQQYSSLPIRVIEQLRGRSSRIQITEG